MSELVQSLKGSHEKGVARGRYKRVSASLAHFTPEEVRTPKVLIDGNEDRVERGELSTTPSIPSCFISSRWRHIAKYDQKIPVGAKLSCRKKVSPVVVARRRLLLWQSCGQKGFVYPQPHG